jgi:hypothetical protein
MTSGVTDKLQIDLRFQLKALSETYWHLGARLAQAAKELHDPGIPPSAQLLEELASARQAFTTLRAQLLELTQVIETTPAPDPDKMISLKDLVGVMQDALEVKKKSKADEAKQQVLRRLGQVLQLTHKDKPDFAPLLECQAKARELQSALTDAEWENPSPDSVHALVPFSDLLKIVEQLEQLDDETLERLQDVTTEAFGKLLTLAASRGRLVFRDAAPGPASAVEVTTPAASAGAEAAQPTEKAAAVAAPTTATAPPAGAGIAEMPPESQELVKRVTELYSLLGHKVEKIVPRPDRDVDLTIHSSSGKTWIARCRSQEETVNETEVRNFYGVMQQEQAAQGAIITLGGFTPQARQWAKSNLLYLLDQKDFFDYLKRARARRPDNGAEGR